MPYFKDFIITVPLSKKVEIISWDQKILFKGPLWDFVGNYDDYRIVRHEEEKDVPCIYLER